MNNYAGILLITEKGTLLLQQRDDKPGIANPGLVTTFGGKVENGETVIQGALREITEETNLLPKEKDLTFFKTFPKTEDDGTKTLLNIYLLQNISKDNLKIYEGQGYYEISKDDDLSNIKLSPSAKNIVTEYFKTH